MLVSFLLYKEWLLGSLEAKSRCMEFPYCFYIHELSLRRKVYVASKLKCFYMDPILQCLETMNNM